MEQFDTPVYKIASASLTDDHLLRHIRKTGKPVDRLHRHEHL